MNIAHYFLQEVRNFSFYSKLMTLEHNVDAKLVLGSIWAGLTHLKRTIQSDRLMLIAIQSADKYVNENSFETGAALPRTFLSSLCVSVAKEKFFFNQSSLSLKMLAVTAPLSGLYHIRKRSLLVGYCVKNGFL